MPDLRRRLFLLIPLLVWLGNAVAGGLDSCLGQPEPARKSRCLESYLATRAPTKTELEGVRDLLAADDEAAELIEVAISRSEGSHRLTWLDGGEEVWSSAIDPGDGRLERAAEALVAAGRPDRARSLLERALALGAGGWVRETWERTGAGAVPGLDPAPTPLMAEPWFRRVPDLEISIVDGEPYRLSSATGKVLLLDFWATWCAPCVKSLPNLQTLKVEVGDGFVPLAVNAQENDEQIRVFTRSLDLTLPVGRYDEELERAFRVRSLPTAILVDQKGRVRRRWDGYKTGLEWEIAEWVRSLLSGNDPASAPQPVAEVLAGGALVQADWTKRDRSPIEALVTGTDGEGKTWIGVKRPGMVVLHDPLGLGRKRLEAPSAVGLLRTADLDADGSSELVGFRAGGSEFAVLEPGTDEFRVHPSPAYLLDVALLPAEGPDSPGRIVLATVEGVYLADRSGKVVPVEGTVETVAVSRSGTENRSGILALTTDGSVQRLDRERGIVGAARAPEWSRRLVTGGGTAGWGALPGAIESHAVGRFLPGSGNQAALVTGTSQLLVVDLDRGEVLIRVRWPEIGQVAAGDLDGDGLDELLVGAGPSLTALSIVPPAEIRKQDDSR